MDFVADITVPNDTEAAFQHLADIFPSAAVMGGKLPRIVLKHQLYALVEDRTQVDRHVVCRTGRLAAIDAL